MKSWLIVLTLIYSSFCYSKTFRWKRIEVQAFLDKKGNLEVTERLRASYNGIFNGAERYINLRKKQKMKVKELSIYNYDQGRWINYKYGSLKNLRSFNKISNGHYRWRSFHPGVVSKNVIHDYKIKYEISPVITKSEGVFSVNHNFAFNDVAYSIDYFSVKLHFDDAYEVPEKYQVENIYENLIGGTNVTSKINIKSSVIDKLKLYENIITPKKANKNLTPAELLIAILIFFLTCFIFCIKFFRDLMDYENKKNRFTSLKNDFEVNYEWVKANVCKYSPELVSAVWDQEINNTEVGVILSRMITEGKIEVKQISNKGWLARAKFSYKPLVDVKEFYGVDSIIREYIFINENDPVTTDDLKEYYSYNGSTKPPIVGTLEFQLRALAEKQPDLKKDEVFVKNGMRTFGLISVCFLFFGIGVAFSETFPRFIFNFHLFIGHMVLFMFGRRLRENICLEIDSYKKFFNITILFILFISINYYVFTHESPYFLPCALFFHLFLLSSTFNRIKTVGSESRVKARKKFQVAREFFIKELKKREPFIDDLMTPYILALNLEKDLDSWNRVYKDSAKNIEDSKYISYGSRSPRLNGSLSTNSSGSSSPNWTGGGGSFSGGGASGSWSDLSSVSSSSTSFSSSSGGGGFGGGGGSSGGGGGGGW